MFLKILWRMKHLLIMSKEHLLIMSKWSIFQDIFKIIQKLQLKAALNEAQKNASLLAEYHELYELQRRRLESQVFMLTEERELWSTAAYSLAMKVCLRYSKTCIKWPLKNRQSKDLYDKW